MVKISRGYVRFRRDALGSGLREKIKQDLTVVPVSTSSFSEGETVIRLWSEDGDMLGVPRGYFNEHVRRYVDEYQFTPSIGGNELRAATPITPRAGQDKTIAEAVASLRSLLFGGVIIEASVASGKTAISLEIARQFGLKVLVSVHTSVLASQWKTEIAKFFPGWRIGTLQADKIDYKDKDIVVGMLQSLSMKDYSTEVYDEFGFLIVDEIHVCGAPEFSKVLERFTPKYVLGLSGTIKRSDRAENVFIHSVGKVIQGSVETKVLEPTIFSSILAMPGKASPLR